jgi:hypothetical protein
MKRLNQWIVVMLIILLAFLLSACGQEASPVSKADPASIEEISGSDLKRVVLTEKAAERLGIQTATVRNEQVMQKQTVVGEVVAEKGGSGINANQLWVHTAFNEIDYRLIARDQSVRIIPLTDDEEENSDGEQSGWTAEPDDGEDNDLLDAEMYYVVDSSTTGLVPGQHVFVEVALSGNGAMQKAVPYAALIYDVDGETWVYVKEPNALAFVRERVIVDYIKGDLAFLTNGPPAGMEVVTVGGAELFGAETGVSK